MPKHVQALKSLPERIKAARLARGLNQTELGEAVGMPTERISDYERGRREPSLSVAAAIADFLGIDLFPTKSPAASR